MKAIEGPPDAPVVALFTDTYDEINGVGNTYRRLVDYCERRGRRLDIFTYSRKTSVEELGPVRILRFSPNFPVKIYQDLIFDPVVYQPGIVREFSTGAYDIIHTATPGSIGLHALLMATRCGAPLVGAYHTAVPEYGGMRVWGPVRKPVTGLLWRYVRWYYNHCKVVLAPSEHTRNDLKERLKTDVGVFSRGVDTEKFSPDFRLTSPGTEILYVGRLAVEKNLGLLAEFFKDRKDVRLKLVGDGPYRHELEMALGSRSKFTGVLTGESLARAYASADIFVCPSETETFGNVVLEAMSSGLPVVVTDKWAPKELVEDGKTGFVAKGRKDFHEKVEMLIKDPVLRDYMGRNARAAALDRSWDTVFDKLFDEYARISDPL